MRYHALIPASGSGTRFGAESPKQYALLEGKPLLLHAIERLTAGLPIQMTYVVLADNDRWFDRAIGKHERVTALRCGGKTRAETVRNGLDALSGVDADDWIVVHDAVRPCVDTDSLLRLQRELVDDAVGGLLAIPVVCALKRADERDRCVRTESREGLWQAQTPQMFRYRVLREAYARPGVEHCVDESQAVEALGSRPRLVAGNSSNLKVSYPEDLTLAAAILAAERGSKDMNALAAAVSHNWNESIVPQLVEYIRIPAKSPHFDPQWEANGHIERVIRLAESWVRQQPVRGLALEIARLPGRTPVLYFDVPGTGDRTVLLYGHLDKQPEMTGWREGLGPWLPVIEDGKLYGRGGADDGYAVFASLAAIGALQAQGTSHARCIGLIETCEESGSYDLPAYLELLAPRIGRVDFVIGLDSGCGDYERLWATTSLRGLTGGTLTVDVLTEGVHSGDASGIVPSSFRIARKILDRLEDSATGRILPREFHVPIPEERVRQARQAAAIMGVSTVGKYPFAGRTQPMIVDHAEAILNRTWRPALSVTGAGGFPAIADAGNVLRPRTSLKLSLRLPPPVDGADAARALTRLLEADPPHGATVRYESDEGATGWNAPPTAPWLERAIDEASRTFYDKPAAAMGEGGTIPFMAMLGKHFPEAQFLITGVLGPKSNAHGPNEFLHIPYATKLTACVAAVLAAHAARTG